jgi:hypothetical protein
MRSVQEFNMGIYRRRFEEDIEFRKEMYTILCEKFFKNTFRRTQ